jgi:CO/xanthine dehydrogenase FAD-binding subunit
LALGAVATTQEKDGSVVRSVEELLEARRSVSIARLHVPVTGLNWGEDHIGRTPADEPIVAAVAAVDMTNGTVSQARVALSGVWARPVGLVKAATKLVGKPLTQDQIQAVAADVAGEVEPVGDFRGSEEYRRAMAVVLTRRTLEQCMRKEQGNE